MGSDLLHGEVLVGFAVSLTAIAIHSVMMAVLYGRRIGRRISRALRMRGFD
jgi:hypothetical protein